MDVREHKIPNRVAASVGRLFKGKGEPCWGGGLQVVHGRAKSGQSIENEPGSMKGIPYCNMGKWGALVGTTSDGKKIAVRRNGDNELKTNAAIWP